MSSNGCRSVVSAIVAEIDGSGRYRDDYVFEPQLIVRESTGPLPANRITSRA